MNNKVLLRTLFSLTLCIVLCAAAVTGIAETVGTVPESIPVECHPLGEGKTPFLFSIVDDLGQETCYEIYTNAETVGEALLSADLIEGEAGPYGLYIKTVNGILADLKVNGHYWAFYIDGEYALSGVDTTAIEPDHVYMLKFE